MGERTFDCMRINRWLRHSKISLSARIGWKSHICSYLYTAGETETYTLYIIITHIMFASSSSSTLSPSSMENYSLTAHKRIDWVSSDAHACVTPKNYIQNSESQLICAQTNTSRLCHTQAHNSLVSTAAIDRKAYFSSALKPSQRICGYFIHCYSNHTAHPVWKSIAQRQSA